MRVCVYVCVYECVSIWLSLFCVCVYRYTKRGWKGKTKGWKATKNLKRTRKREGKTRRGRGRRMSVLCMASPSLPVDKTICFQRQYRGQQIYDFFVPRKPSLSLRLFPPSLHRGLKRREIEPQEEINGRSGHRVHEALHGDTEILKRCWIWLSSTWLTAVFYEALI